ncbi:MAG: DNA-binding domain-containing protein [Polyangiaceae bacterium]
MSVGSTPDWLAAFQAEFGAVLRVPLDRSTSTLRASPSSYEASIVRQVRERAGIAAKERLACYNRQYWFRLFTTLQRAFPLTTRLFGHWAFNALAEEFLLTQPPSSWDIDRVADGFEDFLAQAVDRTPPATAGLAAAAAVEAARIDAAFRHVLRAPQQLHYRPRAEDAGRLEHGRLLRSAAAAVVEEHWPLCQLRRSLAGDDSERALPLPDPLAAAQYWAVLRAGTQIRQVPLEAGEARLLNLLSEFSVAGALGELESTCSPAEREQLPGSVRRWLARSVEMGFWRGLAAT